MIVKVLSSYNGAAKAEAEKAIRKAGAVLYQPGHFYCDLIVCPDYDIILTDTELREPNIGVLVFHPSPLPRMRGRDAIKRQYKAGDKVGGGTWFWASSGIDNGDICEQEIVLINSEVRPREYYENKIIPLMVRTLERAILGVMSGRKRSIPQNV